MSSTTITIDLPNNMKIEKPVFQKMLFISNALEKGWTVRRSNTSYIFTKKHENLQEIFQEDYLETFVESNCSNDFILSNRSTNESS